MRAHLVGGGLASLAAAVHLIQDAAIPGSDIQIYEAAERLGGSQVGFGGPISGYVLPGGRVFEKHYRCALDLFSLIPSASDPEKSIKQEIEEFHTQHAYHDKTRLVGQGATVIDGRHLGLSWRDRFDLIKMALTPEWMLDGKRIDVYFRGKFFQTNFWFMWTTIMNPLPQHCAVEMRRFLLRFLHLMPDISTMAMIYRTRYNQNEAIIEPISKWLMQRGVIFHTQTLVKNIRFKSQNARGITATGLQIVAGGRETNVQISDGDLVLVTNGSQLADYTVGSVDAPPVPSMTGRSWELWANLAGNRKDFGNPSTFFDHISDSKWISFTVTATDRIFFDLLEKFTGSETGRQGLISFIDSNWLLTIATFHQPEFLGQPENIFVCWGFDLYPDKLGNFIRKPMSECSGSEIFEEVLRHLKFDGHLETIMRSSKCIPVLMPQAGSIWAVRRRKDRPPVIPNGSTNFGFIGQFSEMPSEAAFTMEYAVRSGWLAVSTLLKLDRKPPPIYQGRYDIKVLYHALKALCS